MANMGYCRFHNTYQDLTECYDALCDGEKLSKSEFRALKNLVSLCNDIAEEFDLDDLSEFQE